MNAYEEAKAMFYSSRTSKTSTASNDADCYDCRRDDYVDDYDDADCVFD